MSNMQDYELSKDLEEMKKNFLMLILTKNIHSSMMKLIIVENFPSTKMNLILTVSIIL